ncbi:MAG: hypothetical protein IPL49_00030 [Saprospirales bacterium]|nr:hypothetical protein [Saprospirales bacterium]
MSDASAKGYGRRRKEAGLQKLVPTNRNRIRGWIRSVRQHIVSKRAGNNPDLVDAAGIGGKRMLLPGEISVAGKAEKSAEVIVFRQAGRRTEH